MPWRLAVKFFYLESIMKKKLLPYLFAGIFGFAPVVFAHGSLDELNKEFALKKAAALELYIAGNPDNYDLEEAEELLVFSLIEAEEYERAYARFEARYAAAGEAEDITPNDLISEYVGPMFYLKHLQGDRDGARAVVEQARARFASDPAAAFIKEALDEMEAMLEQPGVGERIELTFEDLDGTAIDLADYEGRVVMVDFWATWCMPCIRTKPALKAVHEEFKDRGFEILGISLDHDEERLRDYLAREGMTWPQYFDGLGWDNKIAERFTIHSIPASFLIDGHGKIIASNVTPEELRRHLTRLLGEGEGDEGEAEDADA